MKEFRAFSLCSLCLLFLSSVFLRFPLAARQNATPASEPGKQNSQHGGSRSGQEDREGKEAGGDDKNESNPSLVFSRGIVLPDDWTPPKDEAPPEGTPARGPEPSFSRTEPMSEEPSADSPIPVTANPAPPIFGPHEDEIAHRAWRYLIASREPATGFYDSVIHYPATTMWDLGSGIAALVAAERLDLLAPTSFKLQMQQLLNSLEKLPLYHHELPNREYDVRKLVMLDHRSLPSQTGSGWSALDVGRLLIWLKIVSAWYPEMKPDCDRIVSEWDFGRLRLNGEANGTSVENGKEYIRQEGRLGYEQYAAKGFALWGIDLSKAAGYAHSQPVTILGVELKRDDRAHAFLTSEPFFLARMELGSVDPVFDDLSSAVFIVEKRRWEDTGVLTAISEDAVSVAPWFVYNTIFYNRDEWECVGSGGKSYPDLKSLSTKAAIAYAALSDDTYGLELEKSAETLVHPLYGFYAGRYDNGGINSSLNLNTNAIVLEAMLYRKLGRRAFLTVADGMDENHTAPDHDIR